MSNPGLAHFHPLTGPISMSYVSTLLKESKNSISTRPIYFHCPCHAFPLIVVEIVVPVTCFVIIVDIDECQTPDACQSDHVCNNTVGSYTCVCPLGYVADSGPQNPLNPVCVGKSVSHLLATLCCTVA